MCLIAFSLNQHPAYKLILVANRDEFYSRKTEAANFWPTHKNILGGRDVEAMRNDGTCGTWMGMTTSGKLAIITNYRDFKNLKSKAPSRGHLVSEFLIGNHNPADYLEQLEKTKHEYNGYNLIVGNMDKFFYQSNYKGGVDQIMPGLHGLSNHLLDTAWPKVNVAKSELDRLLKNPIINPEELFEIMRNESLAADNQLPDTGIGFEREKALSSMFIKTEGYGTRCSTVILVKQNGETIFTERTYNPTDFTFDTRSFEFLIKE